MTNQERYFEFLFQDLININIAFMALPILIGLFRLKGMSSTLRIALVYCFSTISIELFVLLIIWLTKYRYEWIEPFLSYFEIIHTNFLQILYYLKNFLVLGWLYSELTPSRISKKIRMISLFLIISSLINYLFIEGYHVYGKYNPAVDAIFCLALPSFYLWYINKTQLHFPLNKNSYFWFSFGLLFTNLIGFFLYLTGSSISETDYILFMKLSITRNLFDSITQIIFAIAFWYAPYAKFIPLPDKE